MVKGLERKLNEKKVMVFGTFDLFHLGHESFLNQAKKYGDYLIVVVARDRTVEKLKKRQSVNDEKQRARNVRVSKIANKVVLGRMRDKFALIREYKPDVICLGYDQTFYIDKLKQLLLESTLGDIKIVKLKPFKKDKYKSSIIRKQLDGV